MLLAPFLYSCVTSQIGLKISRQKYGLWPVPAPTSGYDGFCSTIRFYSRATIKNDITLLRFLDGYSSRRDGFLRLSLSTIRAAAKAMILLSCLMQFAIYIDLENRS